MGRWLALLALVGGGFIAYRQWRASSTAGTSSTLDDLFDWASAADAVDYVLHGNFMPRITPYAPPSAALIYLPAIRKAEQKNGIPPDLLVRLLEQESGYRPDVIDGDTRSSTGAVGIAQVMPATAKRPGLGVAPLDDPTDPWASIAFAGEYLRALYDRAGTWSKALAAYNFGLGNVLAGLPYPRETRNYVASITHDVPVA